VLPNKLSPVASIIVGVILIVAMAVLQGGFLPTPLVAAFGPAIVVISTVYGITPSATAALLRSRLSPHLVAMATALLGALAGLLPVLTVGSLLRIIFGVLLAVGAVLLPGTQIGTAASTEPPVSGVVPAGNGQQVPPIH
jgi:hypothetical protein